MTRIFDGLRQRVIDFLCGLAARPFSLFCLLLATNAVALPYLNLNHDAILYGVQVLNRVSPGHFAGDLYFEYGSQDRYSLFSSLAAPLVARLGLHVGFFLLYVASNALFLFALQRFVCALVKDPLISTLSLLFLAVTLVPFGGLHSFHVNEPFLTPRIAANALVLLALERLLSGRLLLAFVLIAPALLLHPLMAFPGFLIILGWLSLTRLRPVQLAGVLTLAALAAAGVLLYQPLALRLFGSMNDDWRAIVDRTNPYNFPLNWSLEDWVRIAVSFTVALTAAWHLRADARIRRLLLAVSSVAAVGLIGGVLACFLPYALLFQGQPYRWLWPLELSLFPLSFLVGHRLWRMGRFLGRLTTLGLLAYLNNTAWSDPILMLFLSSTALLGMLYWRGLAVQPRDKEWSTLTAVFALAATLPLWTTFKLADFALYRPRLESLLEANDYFYLLPAFIDPLCKLALIVLVLTILTPAFGLGRGLRLASLAGCLGAFLVSFAFPQTPFYSQHYARFAADEQIIAEFLVRHQPPETTPTVYWPCGVFRLTWIELRANSYFEWPHQIAGNLFNSRTAFEGERRLRLVKKFELQRFGGEKLLYSPDGKRKFLKVYGSNEAESPPELDDFLALCREKRLDFAILPQEFKGLYAATTGKFFIYDCRAIRAKLEGPAAACHIDPQRFSRDGTP
jgi:hypothetical protein